jgi:hypothetical protein
MPGQHPNQPVGVNFQPGVIKGGDFVVIAPRQRDALLGGAEFLLQF